MKKIVFIVLCRKDDLYIENRGLYDCFPCVEKCDGMTSKMALDRAFPKVYFYRHTAHFVAAPGTFEFDGQEVEIEFLVVTSFESLQHLCLIPSRMPSISDDTFVTYYFERIAKKQEIARAA